MIEEMMYRMISGEVSAERFWKLRERAKKSLLGKIAYFHMMKNSNSSIPLSTVFKGRPNLPHGIYGIFVSMGAKIGKNVTIMHQVTIGSATLNDSKKNGSPIIGDNVFIGAGAKIIGRVTIGDNVRIGAGCVVAKDIKKNSTVVLGNILIIEHDENRCNDFVSYSEFNN